ncbi:hypothetical protein ACERK3_03945 [Phycisphaerales bacterium AB-hyl4]|uniref:Fructose-bisphosphate aldolase n=1 Tax=Natronomicrosphaera hydrolytica TaxID=3242702 RepID=A0ABV4U1M2_9BACT
MDHANRSTVVKSLDAKLARIHADPSGSKDFILADAKDADMAHGLAAPGQSPEQHNSEARYRTLAEYRDQIRRNVKQGLVDIMLMSASTGEVLTIKDQLFRDSHITPACRANDTTEVWLAQGGRYGQEPSRPFRTATIDHMMCGRAECAPGQRTLGVDLGLYSLTFNNNVGLDHKMLEQYRDFRVEAEQKGFRHFLELFDPNACGDACPPDIGRFLNDHIARTLAGVTSSARPLFLKMPYHGPKAMEALVTYDPHLVVGILGGSSGTTFDAFHQLWEARKYGARAALYGRMINNSEHQESFIQHLRWLADGELNDPAEAVRSYHGALQKVGVQPYRPLDDDLKATPRGSSYDTTKSKTSVVAKPGTAAQPAAGNGSSDDAPDFAAMTPEQKVKWNLNRWKKVLG